MAHNRDLNSAQVVGMIDEMVEALNGLKYGALITVYDEVTGAAKQAKERTPSVVYLLSLLSAARRDGYRTNSMPSGGAGSVLDDQGMPMPPLSDPTGELATADDRIIDPIRHNGDAVFRGLTGALGDLRMALGSLIKIAQQTQTFPGEPGCVNCAQIGRFEEVTRGVRCRWCHDFWLAQKVDAPLELLQARADGKKITQQMIDQALQPARFGRTKAKRAS